MATLTWRTLERYLKYGGKSGMPIGGVGFIEGINIVY